MAERRIRYSKAANLLGISESLLLHRMDSANVFINSLSYDDETEMFTAVTKGGRRKILYVVENPQGRSPYFTSIDKLDYMYGSPDLYPKLRESATAVYAPTLHGRNDLL